MAYNRDVDEIYLGGVGTLEKWKVSGAEVNVKIVPVNVIIPLSELFHLLYWVDLCHL